MGDALLVPTADAHAMLAKYVGTIPVMHRLVGDIYMPLSPRPERVTAPEVLGLAEKIGFRFLGLYEMMGVFPWVLRTKRERWVDPTGVVVMSARGGFAPGMSKFLLSTFFDDGTSITTWGRKAPAQSGGKTTERDGTGELDFDYPSHLEAVRAACAKGKKAIAVSDLATSLALAHYYERFLRPESVTAIITTRVMLVVMIAYTAYVVVRRMRRGH